MGNRPVRSTAVHWLRWIVRDLHVRGESKGNEAKQVLVRGEGEVKVGEAGMTGSRRVEGASFRVNAMPRRRVSKWPREVEIDSGGNLRTREGVSWGSPWIKPRPGESTQESGDRRRAEGAMEIRDIASVRETGQGEVSRVRRRMR
jgi:hypothetical protein